MLKPGLLAPFANPAHPVFSKLLLPLWRGVSDLAYIFAMALAIYLLYRLLATMKWFHSRRIALEPPHRGQIRREALLNANLALAGGIQCIAYLILWQLGLSKLYPAIEERGWPYSIGSLILFAVASDAWFYFCHHCYHRSRHIFRHVHSIHHQSVVTTPMTNSQVSPWDLLPSGFFGIVFVMTIPFAVPIMTFMAIVFNLYLMLLHSGYEIFPRGMANHWFGKLLVTPTYHQMHHELFTKHMGLYFTWCDRFFNTYSGHYEKRFAEVTSRE